MVKTAVLVSGGGANLQALIDADLFGEIKNCDLCAVISSVPGVYALKRAEHANIPSYVVDASIFPNRASFTEAMIKKLNDLDIELVVLAGFRHYLEIQFFREYKGKIILTYPSLLPAFFNPYNTGVNACAEALAAGVRYTGATTCLITDLPENCLIIQQKPVPVMSNDTEITLQRKIMESAEWDILVKSVSLYCEGKLIIEDKRIVITE